MYIQMSLMMVYTQRTSQNYYYWWWWVSFFPPSDLCLWLWASFIPWEKLRKAGAPFPWRQLCHHVSSPQPRNSTPQPHLCSKQDCEPSAQLEFLGEQREEGEAVDRSQHRWEILNAFVCPTLRPHSSECFLAFQSSLRFLGFRCGSVIEPTF